MNGKPDKEPEMVTFQFENSTVSFPKDCCPPKDADPADVVKATLDDMFRPEGPGTPVEDMAWGKGAGDVYKRPPSNIIKY